jgi:ankyrin repeat protein
MDPDLKFLRIDLENGYIASAYYKFDDLIKYGDYELGRQFLKSEIDRGYLKAVKLLLKLVIEDYNNLQMAELILDILDPNFYYYDDRSPLDSAIIKGNPNMVDIILRAGANPNNQNSHGMTSLLVALEVINNSTPKIAQSLINHGANPNISDNEGDNPYIKLEAHQNVIKDNLYWELLKILDSHTDLKDPGYY